MNRILIDMDDVMAETGLKILSTYNNLFRTNFKKSDFKDKEFKEIFDLQKYEIVKKEVVKKGFFIDIEVKPNAIEIIKELNEKYDVYVVSAANEFPNSLSDKLKWLNTHFPFISWKKTVFCGYKHMIKADIMIDDHTKNLVKFEGETKLMFDAMHNQKVTDYQRIMHWNEIGDLLL